MNCDSSADSAAFVYFIQSGLKNHLGCGWPAVTTASDPAKVQQEGAGKGRSTGHLQVDTLYRRSLNKEWVSWPLFTTCGVPQLRCTVDGVWARYMIGIWVLALGMNGIVWLLALLVIGIEYTPVIIGMVYWHSVWLLSMIIRLLSMNSIWLAFLKAGIWTLDCSELVY